MAEQNKETFQQLKKYASHLQKIVFMMQSQYRTLTFFAYAVVLCLIVILILLIFVSTIIRKSESFIFAIVLMVIVYIVSIVDYMQLRKQGMIFRQKYQEGRKVLQIMVDKAEWSRYKKRLIYRGNDEIMDNAIDKFFLTSEKVWSPCRSEKRFFSILMLIFPSYILISFIAFIIKLIMWI